MITPDKSVVIFSETDVTTPAGLKCNDSYDLTLYHDLSRGKKGVLVVSMTMQVIFSDGQDAAGNTLSWDKGSKSQFLSDYKSAVHGVWNNKWRITTTSNSTSVNDIGVIFDPSLIESSWYWGDHWELNIKKTEGFLQSWVNPLFGTTKHDSQDLNYSNKMNKPGCSGSANVCAIKQRGAVHEFGHMLGLRDEYPAAKDNGNWESDGDSVMHSGETVRPRHYAMFADWLTQQFSGIAYTLKETIKFKVDGTWDLSNAKL